ncbi:Amino-acid carrier protein AlsT [Planctomycetes bacterium Pla163]|uniref:Amino-acid carrier protein AlsT n=1 Tax=Rohdeia mirabilis TaxID=2528008 RepID=A0A518D227_9BACT|nr:Amino-acid carrier protein AlsT [Planctomycetes bacterium Pla163]
MRSAPQLQLLSLVLFGLLAMAPAAVAQKSGADGSAIQDIVEEVASEDAESAPPAAEQGAWSRIQTSIDSAMGAVNGAIETVFFVDVWFWDEPSEELVAAAKAADERVGEVRQRIASASTRIDTIQARVDAGEALTPADDQQLEDAKSERTSGLAELDGAKAARREAQEAASHIKIPFAVLWLVFGAIFFTFKMGFINLRAFGHAISVVRGRFTNPAEKREGEVSHFQALSAALSATVGLGNIAGVAIAIGTGGPGATFWMILAGLLGMSSKFTECTLGQMYKERRTDGSVMGGAMYYLSKGLREKGMGGLGMFLAYFFAVLCIGGSLAGGNSFQVNQSLKAIESVDAFAGLADYSWAYGLLMTVAVGIVIIGGIKRIAQVAEKVVPSMCLLYAAACLYILASNFGAIPDAIGTILSGAFTADGMIGGVVGVLIVGFTRAAFSNEAGIGSAAIAHSAAHTEYPAREGIVALLEPFIDTVVVCTMTALVIVITGAYDTSNETYAQLIEANQGAALTSAAMGSQISWFPYVLAVATMLFAFSTMIAWSYYGERCWSWMFGDGSSLVYKVIFLIFTFLGSVLTATNVLAFGDLMILGMALPNVLGVLILSGKVKGQLTTYMGKLRNGEFETFK